VRALQYRAKELDVDLPLISQILPSNKAQIQNALDQILEAGKKDGRPARLQASRPAPTICARARSSSWRKRSSQGHLAEDLRQNVSLAKLVGANKEYIEKQIPHLSSLALQHHRRKSSPARN